MLASVFPTVYGPESVGFVARVPAPCPAGWEQEPKQVWAISSAGLSSWGNT